MHPGGSLAERAVRRETGESVRQRQPDSDRHGQGRKDRWNHDTGHGIRRNNGHRTRQGTGCRRSESHQHARVQQGHPIKPTSNAAAGPDVQRR